jgi:hypothetical protein
MKAMRGFMWHVNLNPHGEAIICLLSELRCRIKGAKVDEAWAEGEELRVSPELR